ncbi:DUF5085 family protein [Listeria grandensis]|uniref:DUF5085 family protein n=1 Tax=Listeria grandensis TaxID=1494963 RepID=UPI001628789B|nr:DUF5085 family protein [Listeria grandensis]MBC1476012.1 DUF5085 family protein [Listeria grandensis]
MVVEEEKIAHKNVISKQYWIHYTDFEKALDDFINMVLKEGMTLKGNIFYSLNNVPVDENMHIEIFIPVHEDYYFGSNELTFRSYFLIDQMIMSRYTGDYRKFTEFAYAEILTHMDMKDLEQITPFFHELAGDSSMQYTQLKVGIREKL